MQDLKNDSFSITIYPNPVSDILNMDLQSSTIEKGMIQIINTLGQVILSELFTSTNIKINTSNIISGVYLVKITAENKQVVKRISIQ